MFEKNYAEFKDEFLIIQNKVPVFVKFKKQMLIGYMIEYISSHNGIFEIDEGDSIDIIFEYLKDEIEKLEKK